MLTVTAFVAPMSGKTSTWVGGAWSAAWTLMSWLYGRALSRRTLRLCPAKSPASSPTVLQAEREGRGHQDRHARRGAHGVERERLVVGAWRQGAQVLAGGVGPEEEVLAALAGGIGHQGDRVVAAAVEVAGPDGGGGTRV